MIFIKIIKTIKYQILFLLLLANPPFIYATKDINSQENQENQETQPEEPAPKSGNSIKAYSTGTIYKEIAPEPSKRRKTGNATNDGDPGFPGDPGQGLPVGDGIQFLIVAGFFYFIFKKLTLKQES